ncbi:MAG: hypothetical protein ABEH66_06730, partial [Halobacteriales archaeon]
KGMYLHRSADWQLKLTDYLAKYNDDAVEFSHHGTPYMYFPKTGHEWKLLPFPHTVPTWEGGALVHPDGEIEHLSPAEAQDNEILDGQRLYPITLTRTEVGSLGYREGIINQLPIVGAHENEIEIAGLPAGADNEQPFVIDLAGEQMSYVTAMEPYGEDTRGLDEVWFANAETGEYTFFGTDRKTLTGPERAMGIARSADSQTNWGANFVVTEPVPVTVDGSLWWLPPPTSPTSPGTSSSTPTPARRWRSAVTAPSARSSPGTSARTHLPGRTALEPTPEGIPMSPTTSSLPTRTAR